MVEISKGVWTRPLKIEQSYGMVHKERAEALVLVIEEESVSWYYNIMRFLELGVYLDGANKRKSCSIRMMAMQYILCGGHLYRRSYDDIHLRCLKKKKKPRKL